MTRRPDLGPVLAIAGAAIAVLAIIAGFLVIGGPGDERSKRLDDFTERRIDAALTVVNCAFQTTGLVPATLAEAAATRGFRFLDYDSPCRELAGSEFNEYIDDRPANEAGEISYAATAPNGIRLCGYFHSARKAGEPNCSSSFYHRYPALDAPSPAGSHCYDITLTKNADMEFAQPAHRIDCAFEIMH